MGAWIIRGVVGRKGGVGQAGRFVAYYEYMLVIETVFRKMTKEELSCIVDPYLVRVTGLASPLCGSMCHKKGMKCVIDADKIHK